MVLLHLVASYPITYPIMFPAAKKVLQFNKHELSTYSVLGTKDLQLSQTSSLPCLLVGVVCRYLNLVNYTRTRFLGEGESPKGGDGVPRQ